MNKDLLDSILYNLGVLVGKRMCRKEDDQYVTVWIGHYELKWHTGSVLDIYYNKNLDYQIVATVYPNPNLIFDRTLAVMIYGIIVGHMLKHEPELLEGGNYV